MKIISIVLAFLANASMTVASPNVCQDFSGSWMGECTQPGGETSLAIVQNGCHSLESDGDVIATDGQSHEAQEGQYVARWSKSGAALEVFYKIEYQGVNIALKINFVQDTLGKQTIYRKMTRTFAGKSETLETCTFRRK